MSNYAKIEFCCRDKKCPIVVERPDGLIDIGSPEEGITTWEKRHLADFVKAAREGKFDQLIKE